MRVLQLLIPIVCCAAPVLGAPVEGSLPIQWNIWGRGLQGVSTSAPSSSSLRTANVYPAPEPLRGLRSQFSLSSHRLRQSSSDRYWRRRGPERDAAGENDLGTI